MKIAVVASGLAYEAGAIPIRARLEATRLVNRGHDVIGFCKRTQDFSRAKTTFPCRKTVPIVLPRPFASLSMWFTYECRLARALLKEDKPYPFDLIIAHEQVYGITLRLIRKTMGAKWICLVQRTIYDTISSGRCPFNPIHARLLQWGSNYEFAHAAAIVTLHDEMTKEIKDRCPQASITRAIPNGITVEEDSFDEIHNNRKKDVILYAGRLSPEKCVDVLIHAFARLKSNAFELRIVGHTPGEDKKLKKLAESSSIAMKVRFLGALSHSEVLREMRIATIFVLPSVSEGLPFVILEAMANGVPVIASNIPGTRAIIGVEDGILIPPQDDRALVEAMNRLLSDPKLRYSLSRSAFQRIKGYSWDRITRVAAEFYETIGA